MKKYNLSQIMTAAWRFFRKGVSSFAVALRMAWANAKSHNTAKEAAGITEETHTWSGWKTLGFEVIHESISPPPAGQTHPSISALHSRPAAHCSRNWEVVSLPLPPPNLLRWTADPPDQPSDLAAPLVMAEHRDLETILGTTSA